MGMAQKKRCVLLFPSQSSTVSPQGASPVAATCKAGDKRAIMASCKTLSKTEPTLTQAGQTCTFECSTFPVPMGQARIHFYSVSAASRPMGHRQGLLELFTVTQSFHACQPLLGSIPTSMQPLHYRNISSPVLDSCQFPSKCNDQPQSVLLRTVTA